MDIKAIAREIRERIFARVEDDKCLHASSIEAEIEGVLARMAAPVDFRGANGVRGPLPVLTVGEAIRALHLRTECDT